MTIQIGPERTEELLRRAAKNVSRKYTIPGFRPGKAPYAAVLRRFGRERLLGEIIEEIGEEVIREALESNQVTPYGQISLSEVKLDPPTFKVVVPLPPTVELGDYRSIRLEAPEVVVKEEEVDQWLERVRNERTTW
jgi:trigger factor